MKGDESAMRWLASGACDPNYVTQPGVPCVPGQAADFDCDDLAQWGVGGIVVVGDDIHMVDVDADHLACEGLPNPRTTDGAAFLARNLEASAAVVLIFVLACTAMLVRRVKSIYTASDSAAERRAHQMTFAMLALGGVPLALLTVIVFAALGIE